MPTPVTTRVDGRRVLIAIKDRQYSRQAILYYLEHMASRDDNVFVVYNVVPDGAKMIKLAGMKSSDLRRVDDRTLEHGKLICNEAVEEVRRKEIRAQPYLSVNDQSGVAIVEAIKELKIDIVVMGKVDKKSLKSSLSRSVSDYVQRHAHVPVTIIKSDEGHWCQRHSHVGYKDIKYDQLDAFE